MTSLFYSLLSWTAACLNFISEPTDRKRKARKAMSEDLFGPRAFRLIKGERK